MSKTIKVQAKINRSLQKTWDLWTDPMHVIRWNAASDDWYTPYSRNDLKKGGEFVSRMAAKDGSVSFDFAGVYSLVKKCEALEYAMADGRKVKVSFTGDKNSTQITEEFDPESTHTLEMQQAGWQSILDNFKKYAETNFAYSMLRFDVAINAPVALVYKIMLADKTYQQWTSFFDETSHYVGSWDKNSEIRFLSVDENGKKQGMIARIRENIPEQFVSIEHFGLIEEGKEILSGPKVTNWAGALENYIFTADGKKTHLEICVDSSAEYKDYFSKAWPEALNALKKLCEKK